MQPSMSVKKNSSNAPRAGLYALLKSRSQQQQKSNDNNNNKSNSIQENNKMQEKEVQQLTRSPNHSSPVQTKKPPPPVVKPKPKRPINFIRTNSKSDTFVKNSEDKGVLQTKSSGIVEDKNSLSSNSDQRIDDSVISIKPSQLFKASNTKL